MLDFDNLTTSSDGSRTHKIVELAVSEGIDERGRTLPQSGMTSLPIVYRNSYSFIFCHHGKIDSMELSRETTRKQYIFKYGR